MPDLQALQIGGEIRKDPIEILDDFEESGFWNTFGIPEEEVFLAQRPSMR